jgi:hypothetical protein
VSCYGTILHLARTLFLELAACLIAIILRGFVLSQSALFHKRVDLPALYAAPGVKPPNFIIGDLKAVGQHVNLCVRTGPNANRDHFTNWRRKERIAPIPSSNRISCARLRRSCAFT